MYKNIRTLGGRQKIELPLRVRHIGDPKKGSMTAALAEQRLSCNKDTIKIDGLQQLHLPGWSCSFFLPELFNLPVLGILNWASIQTFFDFTS